MTDFLGSFFCCLKCCLLLLALCCRVFLQDANQTLKRTELMSRAHVTLNMYLETDLAPGLSKPFLNLVLSLSGSHLQNSLTRVRATSDGPFSDHVGQNTYLLFDFPLFALYHPWDIPYYFSSSLLVQIVIPYKYASLFVLGHIYGRGGVVFSLILLPLWIFGCFLSIRYTTK